MRTGGVRQLTGPCRLLDLFGSYYGGLLCVCWSPDGRYVLTGGQDDLVSIWSFSERRIVARCQGHHSWVTAVAFDPWRCDGRNYRFGSVGDDCRLLLWDFSEGLLHRPKGVRTHGTTSVAVAVTAADVPLQASGQHRGSLVLGLGSSGFGGGRMSGSATVAAAAAAAAAAATSAAAAASAAGGGHADEAGSTAEHPVEARSQTAILPPIMVGARSRTVHVRSLTFPVVQGRRPGTAVVAGLPRGRRDHDMQER